MTHGEAIKLKIIQTGISIWLEKSGKITSNDVATRLDMTPANVLYHFKSIENLRNSVAAYAVQTDNSPIVLHLISVNHSAVADMSDKKRATLIQLAAMRY